MSKEEKIMKLIEKLKFNPSGKKLKITIDADIVLVEELKEALMKLEVKKEKK